MINYIRHIIYPIELLLLVILGFSPLQAGLRSRLPEMKTDSSRFTIFNTNDPPEAIILLPLETTFNAGDTIVYSGTSIDPQQGTLPPSALTWQVDLHHDSLTTIPVIPPTSGSTGGSFIIPTTSQISDSVWYRITLTAIDSGGLSNTTSVDIFPNTTVVTLATIPSGLQILLDGQTHFTPYSLTSVVGVVRTISITSPVTMTGQVYQFVSWSDGGALHHTLSTPPTTTTYTAIFEPIPAIPVLDVPSDHAINQPLSLPIKWHPAHGAITYQLQLSTDSTFSTTVIDDSTITDTTQPVNGLTNLTEYFWRVRALRPDGRSAFSLLRKFITISPPQTITSTSPLPVATAGSNYHDTLSASGGIQPYAWSVISGSLPAALTLSPSGVIGGIPSVSGNYSFMAQVLDNASRAVTKTFSLTVQPGSATQIVFIQQPTSDTIGAVISPPMTAQLKDTASNNVASAGVLLSLTLSSGTGTLLGTLTRATDTSGLARFNDISLSAAGTKTLRVTGGGLSAGISNSFTLFNPIPVLSTISPISKTAGDPGFTLTVTGSNFVQGSIVRFNGFDRATSFVSSNQLTATLPASDVATAGTFPVTVVNPAPGGGTSGSKPITVLNPTANIKIMLQGPYNSGSMITTLRNSGFLPLNQPYTTAPWNYAGTEHVAAIPSNVVDWVLIELRTSTSAATKVATRAAFIKSNGTVVDVDGVSPVTFSGIVGGNYYIVVKHRNHLAAMSASLVLLNSSSALYDFTTGMSKYFGTEAKNLGNGVFGMFAGDYSQDGFIDSDDFIGPDNEVFQNGYRRSDLNMDGFVDSSDFIDPDNNVFKSTHIPN